MKRKQNKTVGSLCAFLTALAIIYLYKNFDEFSSKQLFMAVAGILFLLLVGIAFWIGHHLIIITAESRRMITRKIEMAKTKEGRKFVEAVKRTVQ